MPREFNLASFAAFCSVGGELMHDIEIAKKAAIHTMAQLIAAEAKRVLGTHDYNWTPLAASTLAKKEPLIRRY